MSPESTPHLTAAREGMATVMGQIREARLAKEADHTVLSSYYQAALRLDNDLEQVEIR